MKKWKKLLILGMTGVMLAGCGQKNRAAEESVSEAAAESTGAKTDAETGEKDENEAEENGAKESEAEENEAEENGAKESEAEESGAKEKGTEENGTDENEAETAGGEYEDNFSVDGEAAADFGKKVKDAAAAGDLEALADLAAYPLYVGFPEGGVSVESREEFLELGADRIFTEALKNALAAADETNLSPSMAGFVLSDENGSANVVFGVRDGKLAVNGINY